MMSTLTNVHMCMGVCYTHRITPTCFGYSYGHPQGGELQRIDTLKYHKSF